MSNKILLGDDYWNTLEGLNQSKMSGAERWENSLSELLVSSNIIFDNSLKNKSMGLNQEKIDEEEASFRPFILGGDYELNPDIYFAIKHKGLKEVAKTSKEDLNFSLYEIDEKRPSSNGRLRT